MAIDFSSLGATPAHTGKIDFSAIGGVPAVGQDEPVDETTALGAAGRGAASMIPLGEQGYSALAGIGEHKPYLQERQELEKEIAADKENHPVARVAGQAAGVVAPALVTGGSSVPATLGEAAGQGAAMGAGFGTGNAIDTLASGGSGAKAAGEIALGTALGGAGGMAGQKLAGLAGKAVPALEEFAAKKAVQGVGMGSKELGNMTQQELIDTGHMLADKGIVKEGASTQQMFDQAKALHEEAGTKIGAIGNQATELGLTTDTKPLLDSLGEKYNAASQLANPDERKAAIFYKRGMADILAMAKRNGAERVAPDIATEQPASFITFDQLQKLKKSYGNSAFENGAVVNPAAADVYGQINAGQKAIVDKAATSTNLPEDLKAAMTDYSKLYPVVDGLKDVLGRERAGNMPVKGFGMMGKLVGQLPGQSNPTINALTSLGLMGAGHPLWGIGAATATLSNPRVLSNLARNTAEKLPAIANALPTAGAQLAGSPMHQNMGETKPVHADAATSAPANAAPTTINVEHPALAPWKQTFQKNAATATNPGEVQKSQAITDFVLSQRDPSYAAAKQKMSDQPVSPAPAQDSTKMADGGIVAKKGSGQFNTDMSDKLRAFIIDKKEKDNAQPR